MVAKCEAKYIRISPTKARMVLKLIKGLKANEAMLRLELLNKKGAYLLNKALKSAISNAKNKGYDENKLYVSKVVANAGPALKRYRAASFGRAVTIRKRTSHILVELDTSEKLIEKEGVK
ncbi:MAG: 50S ribosomal protein L22 [Candidatus Omnitrophica bacterium]|jgi:large subunit ribosomal protein L22|nr:50S ribosomal protein L22 [Candidatus Omnitrophota bacterium]